MFEFQKLCKEVKNMDPALYVGLITEKSIKITAALSVITQNGLDGVMIFNTFVLCSIAADGKLDKSEYEVMKPAFSVLAGKEVTYEEAVQMFKDAGLNKPKDFKDLVNDMVDVIGLVSEKLREDIILVCLMVCAVDGKINLRERKWIKQLMR